MGNTCKRIMVLGPNKKRKRISSKIANQFYKIHHFFSIHYHLLYDVMAPISDQILQYIHVTLYVV
jgi:hypothetical protein